MPIDALLESSSASDDQRGVARWRVRLEVPGASDDGCAPIVIHDISTAGMLIETRSLLKVGHSLTVSLPEAESVAASIVWQNEPLFGCRFDHPLPQAALSAARLRHSIREEIKPADDVPAPNAPAGLPERLRKLRRERGLTRAALSERIGISQPTIWAWETGKTHPRHANLLTLADVFGLTEQELLFGERAVKAQDRKSEAAKFSVADLSAVIDSSKDQIARVAGVQKDKVRIYISF